MTYKTVQELIEDAADVVVEHDMMLDTVEERVDAFMVLVDLIDPEMDPDDRDEIERRMLEMEKGRLH